MSEAEELQLLKARQNEYAAARSVRVAAETEAAAAAAAHALRAATKARKKEKAAIALAEKAKTSGGYAGQIPTKLWDHESGWNHRAENSGSGAYGIPQAYPGSKMASAGSDWRTNPATQIKWGLGYVKRKYKTPCGAWSNFQNNGSY
jgi:hypothetical protein